MDDEITGTRGIDALPPYFRLLPYVSVTIMKLLAASRDRSVAACKTGDHPSLVSPWKSVIAGPEMKRMARQIPWSRGSRNNDG